MYEIKRCLRFPLSFTAWMLLVKAAATSFFFLLRGDTLGAQPDVKRLRNPQRSKPSILGVYMVLWSTN